MEDGVFLATGDRSIVGKDSEVMTKNMRLLLNRKLAGYTQAERRLERLISGCQRSSCCESAERRNVTLRPRADSKAKLR